MTNKKNKQINEQKSTKSWRKKQVGLYNVLAPPIFNLRLYLTV